MNHDARPLSTDAHQSAAPTDASPAALPDLQRKYEGQLAREKKYKKTIDDLRRQQAKDRRLITELRAELAEATTHLHAVRRSWRFRIGSLLVAPASVLRGLLRGTTQPPAADTAAKPLAPRAPRPARLPYEDLERLAAQDPCVDNLLAFAKAAYFERGHIDIARRAIAAAGPAPLQPGQRRLADVIDGLSRMMNQGLPIPPRQPNANLSPAPDRVLYCVHSSMPYLTNGYSTRTHGVATGALRAGIDLVVAARPGFPWDTKGVADTPEGDSGRHGEVLSGVPYVFTPGLSLEAVPLDHYITAAADVYAREAVRHRASVIHAASNHISGLAALIAARRLGLPFVYEVRGLWEVTQASERPEWESSDRYKLAVQLETLVAREADGLMAITSELKAELVARGVDAERIALLPNCVDIEEFAPIEPDAALMADLGLDTAVPTIGFAGSVVPYEGLDLLIEALGRLHAEGVGFNLLIVGDGAALPALRQASESAGITERTRFTGRVPRERVRDLVSCMDIMPCPRRASAVTEMVSPLKPLESMAMAKAVLLSDVAPHLEFAGPDQERARLFRKDDVEDLARALRELIDQPEARQQLGRAARLWVAQQRTWDVAGQGVREAYRQASRRSAEAVAAAELEQPARRLAQLTVALIADRFTTDSLAPDVTLVRPTPDEWRAQLAGCSIDALLVESAWEGNGGAWKRRVGYYSDEEITPLRELVEHCRALGIPTLFWNKEDPVHFNRFERTAALFDHVFTTDSDCVVRYLSLPGSHIRSASALPFFAQPRIHNPLPSQRPWLHDVCYAGSYYGERYAERSRRLDVLLAPAAGLGLTIYDRQHFNPDSPYHFPERLSPFVKGGLDYADMVQAYKSHAVHLNVNSVEKSPTMFSRRVMEIAASGTALLSSVGRGVEQTLAGTVKVAGGEAEAERWLRAWLTDEPARHDAILPAMREVLRAHTAAHRLVQVLRTAGMRVRAPERERYALVCDRLDDETLEAVRAQSASPALIVARRLARPGPVPQGVVVLGDADLRAVLAEHGCEWVGLLASTSALGDQHLYEDLLLASAWSGDHDALGLRWLERSVTPGAHVPLVVADGQLAPSDGLVRVECLAAAGDMRGDASFPSLAGLHASGMAFNRFRAPSPPPGPGGSKGRPTKTILVAGHDLKFLRAVMEHWEREGHRVLVDQWTGHNQHDPARSSELLAQADVVFCEWCLGNAAWYSRHKRPDQRLVVRFHSQELRSPLVAQVQQTRVDRFVFVGAHIRDKALRRFGFDLDRCDVVPNYVADAMFAVDRTEPLPKTVALVGITPQMKRLDLALDLIHCLREVDDDFHLIVKGRRPEEYAWMKSRPDEMRYYEEQYARIRADGLLAEGVVFEPHGDDMADFFRRVGYAISVSDFESFHLTLADGAAAKAMPLSLAWEGADRIYPARWLFLDVPSMARGIQAAAAQPWSEVETRLQSNSAYCRDRFSVAAVAAALDRHCFQSLT
ncbi:MAG: glycosyltransferase [Pseudomonadota bacterium]